MSARRAHGSLESAVLHLLWSSDTARTGREIRDALEAAGDPLAPTTVLTVLARLEKKQLVERNPATRTYRASRSDPATSANSMAEALKHTADRTAALQRFTGALDAGDLRTLRAAVHTTERDQIGD